MLLDEIIALLSSTTGSLADALLKTKILLHQIGRKDLVSWVNSELTGYPDEKVPPYRIVSTEVHGHIMTSAWQMADHLLPTQHLKPEQEDNLTNYPMTSSVETIEESIREYRVKGGGMRRNLPVEASGIFQQALQPGVTVVSAWCQINMGDVENILAEVRSRLLDFALDLRDAVGAEADGKQLEQKAANVDAGKMFNTAIYGSGNTVVLGSHSTQSVTVTNAKGDIESLLKTLAAVGIPVKDLEDLKRAVAEDEACGIKPAVSEGRTGGWFTRLLGRAGKGGINVGVDLLSSTVVKALAAYSGLPM
jgi:hypothetical protein